MKTLLVFLILVGVAHADNCRVARHFNNVVIQDTGLVIVPFAIPVGVPVAAVGTTAYSYRAPQKTPVLDPDYEAFLEWKKQRAERAAAAAAPVSLFATTCVKCHSEGGKGFTHHDFSKPLTAEDRLAAIKSIATGKMPKGRKLEPQAIGDLVGELAGVKPDQPSADPPPKPQELPK